MRTTFRKEPRISAAKLGDYRDASPSRRERILRDQKDPPTVKIAPYERARHAIRAALLSGSNPRDRLECLAVNIEQQLAKNDFDAEALRLSALAVRRFAGAYTSIPFRAALPSLPTGDIKHLVIEGVRVSISPTVFLHKANLKGNGQWGALLVVLRKGEPMSEPAGRAVAELLRMLLRAAGKETVNPDLCLVVDAFSGKVFHASASGRRIVADLECACREIASRWPTLPPRRNAA
jgi:hypothetical protein